MGAWVKCKVHHRCCIKQQVTLGIGAKWSLHVKLDAIIGAHLGPQELLLVGRLEMVDPVGQIPDVLS
eukprot:4856212-Prymnesium_polylepis.1